MKGMAPLKIGQWNPHAPLEERFWRFVDKTDTCWLWKGTLNNYGYGQIRNKRRYCGVHRMVLELQGTVIPKGMVVDHLCRVRHCVNPEHLEIVTAKENFKRGLYGDLKPNKGYCKRGHEFTGDNVRLSNKGDRVQRTCKACASDNAKVRYAKQKAVRHNLQQAGLLRGEDVTEGQADV